MPARSASSVDDMEPKKRWSDLTLPQRVAVVAAAAVEVLVTATALLDLARRPRAQVRGPKLLWFLGCFVQPIGPIAYLRFGRRR